MLLNQIPTLDFGLGDDVTVTIEGEFDHKGG